MVTGAMRTASSMKDYFKKPEKHQLDDRKSNRPESSKSGSNYFKGSDGQWQGKLGKERFPDGKFSFDDFNRVIDENDRFRTFQIKFSVSNRVPIESRKSNEFKSALTKSVEKVTEQIQSDIKINFKKKKKELHITFPGKKNEGTLAKIESHNVRKENAAKVQGLLNTDKYRSLFREEMIKNLKKSEIHTKEADFDFSYYAKECRVSLDLPCQAPKSVSMAMMFEEHFERILRCHEKANEAAVKFVEENYIVTRVQVEGINRRVVTHNMLSAKFTEFYNRKLQPHLHTHNIIFNTTRNPFYEKNKKWSKEFNTIDYKTIIDNFIIIDGVYKGELSHQLKKEGYKIKHDKDNRLNFEIEGFTREQILNFSRTEIEKKLNELGKDRADASAKLRNAANLMTRPEKTHLDIDEWREQVRQEMEAMGIKSPALMNEHQLSPQGIKEGIPAAELKKILSQTAGDFFYSHAAFTKREFINGILERAGDVLSPQYVEDYFNKSGHFIMLGEHKNRTYFSTEKNIEIEQSIYRYIEEGKNKREYTIKESTVNKYLMSSDLKEDQKEAIRFMASCGDRVAAIQGDPGAGKSYMLDRARTLFEKDGYKIVGLAPSNQAALTLRKESGLPASTLHSFFIRLQEESGTWKEDRNPLDLRQTDFSNLQPGSKKEIWIVDESSLIDNYCMKRLLEAAELKEAFVVLIGDKNQLPPIESGRPFYNMINDGKVLYTEIKNMMRQKESWLIFENVDLFPWDRIRIKQKARKEDAIVTFFKSPPFDYISPEQMEKLQVYPGLEVDIYKDRSVKEAVQNIVDGKVLESLQVLQARIHEIKHDEARFKSVAEFYSSLSRYERDRTTIVTSINRDREKINDYVRESLRAKGELGRGHVLDVKLGNGKERIKNFAVGDKIIFLRKGYFSGQRVMKNDTGVIKKMKIRFKLRFGNQGPFLKEYRLITVASKGKKIEFNSDKYKHFDHIFCSTTYKVQSASDKRILTNFDTKQFNVNSKNDLLVKLSRSEGEVFIFTNDRKSLYDAVKRGYEKISINDFSEENFMTHKDITKPGKAELIENISRQFEYENAAFSEGGFIKGTMDIHSEMFSRNETNIEVNELEFKNYFKEKRDNGYFIEVGDLKKITHFSTEENIKIEKVIYEKVENSKAKITGFTEAKVNQYLHGSSLNDSQQNAVRYITTSNDRLRAVQYSPWVGKEFILNASKNFYESEGYKVVALGPSNKVVANLKNKAGFENAFTIHSYLIQLQKEAGTWEADRNPLDLRLANLDGLTPGSHKEIWFVDTASLLDNNAMNKLLEAAELKNAEVVPFGDMNQLQPVGAGRPFSNMIEKEMTGFVVVDDVIKQNEAWQVFNSGNLSQEQKKMIEEKAQKENAVVTFFKVSPFESIEASRIENLQVETGLQVKIYRDNTALRDAIQNIVDDNLPESLKILENRLHEIKGDEDRLQNIADFYTTLSPVEREQTAIITGTNRDREKINDYIRENLKAGGELGDGHVFRVSDSRGNEQDKEFSTGDKIIFLKKEDLSGKQVMKDTTGEIKDIEVVSKDDKDYYSIKIESKGGTIVVDPDDYNFIDHAYCSTTYKEMSSTYQRVLANIDTKQYSVNSRNDLLSKLSGSEGEVFIYTNDRKGLYDSVKGAQEKVSIIDFSQDNFKIHKKEAPKSKDEELLVKKSELLSRISDKVEYKNAAFSKSDFITASFDIYSDMRSLEETDIDITINDLRRQFDDKVKNDFFIEMGDIGDNTYFSTEQNIHIENEIYERVAASKNQVSGFAEAKVREYMENTTLNEGQKNALVFITTAKDRVRAIQGAPGVGKSFMLNIANNFYEEQGYKVVALAPSNKAVQNMKERAGFEDASTIHSYLIKLQKEAGTWETGRDPLDLRFTNLEGLTPGIHKEIWFVDEASLIDNYTMNKLQEAAERKNAELSLIGDMNQLQPVGAGKPFSNMLKEEVVRYVELNEILRQQEEWRVYYSGKLMDVDKEALVRQASSIENNAAVTFIKGSPPDNTDLKQNLSTYRVEKYETAAGVEINIHKDSTLKDAVRDAVDHNIAGSLNKLSSKLTQIEDNVERFQTIAERYANLPAHERENTVIITATNKDRTAINDFVRENLKAKGELGKGYDFKVTDILRRKHIREFSPGDKVIFLKKDVIDDHFISKDDVGVIKNIEGSKITVTIKEKDVVIPADKYDYIDHAYCRTTYRVQGADYDRVYAHINTWQSMINSKNDFLVKISRSKHHLELFTNDRYALYEAIKNDQYKISINDFKYNIQIKNEGKYIENQLKKFTHTRFENSKLPKGIIADLRRGDSNYIKYLNLKAAASDIAKKAHAHKGKRPEKDALNHLEIEKRANRYKEKSEIFYKVALEKYSSYLSKQSEKVNSKIATGKFKDTYQFNKFDRDKFMQQFCSDFIPFAQSTAEINAFNANSISSNQIAENFSAEVDNSSYFVSSDSPGVDVDREAPGIDTPGDTGEGGPRGPGISFSG